MTDSLVHTVTTMGTVVTMQVVGHGASEAQRTERRAAVDRALAWFDQVSDRCSRFDPASELSQLTTHVGEPVEVSALLYEAVRFALAVAEESGGAFDPTIGHRMEALGFNKEFRTGKVVHTDLLPAATVSYRDVHIEPYHHVIMLLRPLVLDLGAVAKGLAIDMAVQELLPFGDFAIDAGGDLYLGGRNPQGERWTVGIRHPRIDGEMIATVAVSDGAICTSGDYERRASVDETSHHLLDPRSGVSADALASVTVLAPSAMVADALATAAFVMGPEQGLALLDRHGVDGLLITPTLERFATPGSSLRSTLKRFVRTPKGLLILVLATLLVITGSGVGWHLVGPGVAAATVAAVLVDLPILRYRKKRWVFPDGAMLTGMIVAMVLSPHEPWHITAITAAVAVLSKYVVRVGTANVFNPAALGLVVTFYLFDTGQSWWGALPELPLIAIALLLAAGTFITVKVNKLPVVLAFLGGYYLLVTVMAFLGDPGHVAELYRAPDLHAALYFAFFMVTDPPTSPPKHRDQIVYGAIVAVVSFAVFELVGAACYMLIGLLVANVWEAGRRVRSKAHRASRAAATA